MNVGYVRLSRDDDKRNYVSIENQMLIIRQYAAERNMVIDRWYEDDGVSGYIFDRPGFNLLMEDLDKDIDRVFVKDFSRLGRHNAKVLLLLDEFQERGKQLIVIDDAYDSSDSDDDTIGIKTWYNEKYVKDTSKKIRCALGARQKEGTLITQPPFGYTRNKMDKTVIEAAPKEAAYVKMIFDLYLKGFGYRKISTYLNDNHVPTPSMVRHERELEEGRHTKRRTASKWSDGMVKDILRNDFYIGTFRCHKRERVTIHGKDRRVPMEKQHTFENHHPPIIDKMTFDLVQEARCKRVKHNYRGSQVQGTGKRKHSPFGNCLFCKDCGSRLTPIVRKTSDRERKYYICSTYNTKGRQSCFKAHLIEEQDLLMDVVNYLQLCKNFLHDMIAAYDMRDWESEKTSVEEKRNHLQKMAAEQKKQLKTLLSQKIKDLAVSPDNEKIIKETYASLQQDLLINIQDLESKLEELNHSKPEICNRKKQWRTALDVLDQILLEGTPDRTDIEILIERIVVDENGLPEIKLKYGLSGIIPYSPANELNRKEHEIIGIVLNLIMEEKRGFTSANYLSAKLKDDGHNKSRNAVLPYIRLLLAMGILEPGDNSLQPYTIVKTPAELRELFTSIKHTTGFLI